MIPLRFFRDDKNVYYNNPDGTTKSMTIQEFEEHFSGGSGGLPEYDSGNAGEVLSVDSDGKLKWADLSPGGGWVFHIEMDENLALNKKWSEINTAIRSGSICIIDFDSGQGDDPFNYSYYLVLDVSYSVDTQFNPVYAVSTVAVEGASSAVYKFSTSTEDGYPVYVS